MLFKEYEELVIEAYRHKSSESSISLNLIHPTPAKLKEQCLIEFGKTVSRKDENTLISFFGIPTTTSNLYDLIRDFDADKFRPLEYYLKKRTTTTDYKNIELLAWLIDFHGRPFDPQKPLVSRKSKDNGPTPPPPIPPGPKKPWLDYFRNPVLLVIFGAVLLIVTGMLLWSKSGGAYNSSLVTNGNCMYWTGDHYEATPCSQRHGDTLVVALDSLRLAKFRRITTPDTITNHSVGKLFYLRKDNKFEYFTARGTHPLYPDKQLRPLSDHIYKTYILPLKPSN